MLNILGRGTERDLEGVVNASGYQLQVLVIWVPTGAGDVEVWEHTMHMETGLLADWGRTKYPNEGDLFHRAGAEVGVADIQVPNGWGSVGLYRDYPTAEGTGREPEGRRGGGATHAHCNQIKWSYIPVSGRKVPCILASCLGIVGLEFLSCASLSLHCN